MVRIPTECSIVSLAKSLSEHLDRFQDWLQRRQDVPRALYRLSTGSQTSAFFYSGAFAIAPPITFERSGSRLDGPVIEDIARAAYVIFFRACVGNRRRDKVDRSGDARTDSRCRARKY